MNDFNNYFTKLSNSYHYFNYNKEIYKEAKYSMIITI